MSAESFGTVERIAVVRALPGLGDFLCAVPALRALRVAFPDATISLVGLWATAPLVRRFDRYVDELLPLPGFPGLPEQHPNLRALPGFLALAHDRRFDLALQLHGSGESTNLLTALLGARVSAGFARSNGFRPDPDRFLCWEPNEPEIRRQLRLLDALGIPDRGEALEFPVADDDRAAVRALDPSFRNGPQPYACVHPGAASPERRWPPERFAEVADGLAARGLRVVLTGSAAEAGITAEIARAMAAPAVDLAGRTDIGMLAAIVAGGRLLVCNDTGVSHLAAALRTPSVVVFTASDPARWAPLDAELHRSLGPGTEPAAVLAAADRALTREGRHAA